jgi:hypothetical protein
LRRLGRIHQELDSMLFQNALKLSTEPQPARRLPRASRRRWPTGRTSGRPASLRPAAELLEDRLLLSAQTAVPTFTILSRIHGNPTNVTPAGGQAYSGPLAPGQMSVAYGVNLITFGGTAGTGAGQTIAIVDAYNDPDIISDANAFSSEFGLQQFNVNGGPTLSVLNENGGTSLPANSTPGGWDMEESLDVEWAHSIAPQANIILFEANSTSYTDMLQAVTTAADTAGVSVVSMSWAGGEFYGETSLDSTFETPNGHQGVTFLASTGDNGTPAGWPAYSPNVVAVGGTSLTVDDNGDYLSESAWSDGGGGISQVESQPSYQVGKVNGTSTTNRTVPDVSMDADPNTGVYVLDSFDGGWLEVGGTSLSCPLWAGLIAIADQGRVADGEGTLDGPSQTLPMLYDLPSSDFHDITTGSNGTYSATTGYDLATGLGTPIANLLIPGLVDDSQSGQAPTISSPSTGSLMENSSLVWSSGNGNLISVADSAAGSNDDSLTLSVSHGVLNLASTTGLTLTAGANDSSFMTVIGTIANLNAALNGLSYTPTSGYSGSDSLSVSLFDSSDALSATPASVRITVNALTPPSVAAPSTATVSLNSYVTFSSGAGNPITLTDPDAGSGTDQLTLTATDGTLLLASTSGLTFTAGSNSSASMTVQGTLANLQAAVNGLRFTATSGFTGQASISLSMKDLGNGLTGSGSVAVTVAGYPVVAAPLTATVSGVTPIVFSASRGDAITLTDAAAGANVEQLKLAASPGVLTLATTSGLTFVAGSNKSASMTLDGTLANLSAALNGLTFTPPPGFSGSGSISILYTDLGNSLHDSAIIKLSTSNASRGVHVTAPGSNSAAIGGGDEAQQQSPANSSLPSDGDAIGFWTGESGDSTETAWPADSAQWAGFAAATDDLNSPQG